MWIQLSCEPNYYILYNGFKTNFFSELKLLQLIVIMSNPII